MQSKLLVLLALLLLPLFFAVPRALAHEGHDHGTEAREQETTNSQTRLDDAKKRICQNRADAIKGIMTRSVKRAENYGKFFTTTSKRVITFVENQQQTVNPQLIDAVEAAQTKFEADLQVMKDKVAIDCDSSDPKGQIKAFQEAHRTVLQDLKNWRTALKNLIAPFKADRTTE